MSLRVLLTGGSGQLGSVLRSELEKRGHIVIAPSHAELDVTDRDKVLKYIKAQRPDAIVNCVAYNFVDKAETEREACRRLNLDAVIWLTLAARELGAKLMHFSSDYVFEGSGYTPMSEDEPTGPLNEYGRTKVMSEQAVRKAVDKHFVVRVSWLYSDDGANFANTMLKLGESRKEIKVVCDQIGAPTYAPMLAKPLCNMLESEEYGTYNLTAEGCVNWADFAEAIFKGAGMDVTVVPITTEEYASHAKRPLNSRLDCTKAMRAGFGDVGTWEDGLKQFLVKKFPKMYL